MSAFHLEKCARSQLQAEIGLSDLAGAARSPRRPTVRAAYRYVTQRPWTRIPVLTRTLILNPVLACLAGGRNKMIASKAYEIFNGTLQGSGLGVRTPETIRDVRHNEIPLWVERFGGHAVVKIPYSNAGQGVYTITSREELDAFIGQEATPAHREWIPSKV